MISKRKIGGKIMALRHLGAHNEYTSIKDSFNWLSNGRIAAG